MQQAARVSDLTAFLIVELDSTEKNRWGRVIEYDETEKIFTNPSDKRTEDYVSGQGRAGRRARMPERLACITRRTWTSSSDGARRPRPGRPGARSHDRGGSAPGHRLAQLIIAEDDVLDGRYLEVHQRLLTMIATQAPVASDLRLISALLHVMKSMERMGDQCVNIAKMLPIVGYDPLIADERMLKNIFTMGKQVR